LIDASIVCTDAGAGVVSITLFGPIGRCHSMQSIACVCRMHYTLNKRTAKYQVNVVWMLMRRCFFLGLVQSIFRSNPRFLPNDVGWCREASGWSPRVKGSLDHRCRSGISGHPQGSYIGARGGSFRHSKTLDGLTREKVELAELSIL